jgi:hypothetical protein
MSNQNGSVFGLTFLFPILNDAAASPSHDLQIRDYLSTLPTDGRSPFALAPGTHLARLAVMDDVIFVGSPAIEEHLQSKYLVFETNCDSDLEPYLRGLVGAVTSHIDAIWQHCTGYPGCADFSKLLAYMKACQITTSFFFAAVNNKTVPQTLVALQTQQAVADFIASHQGMEPAQLQREFLDFMKWLRSQPPPAPGVGGPLRIIKTGGHNE